MRLHRYPPQNTWRTVTQRPTRSASDVMAEVAPIFEAVRQQGDEALRSLTRQYDGADIGDLRVAEDDIHSAGNYLTDTLRQAIQTAAANIRRFHSAQVEESSIVETMPGVACWRRSTPVDPVGLYIPGGTAPLFSTVLMLGIPASLAGCDNVIMATPPDNRGVVHPAILFAADLVGIRNVFRVGGAQAIAAMALGTESIMRVNKIFGPGNQYVNAAKQMAFMEGTAIDMPAGPTEVAIVADNSCNARFVAYDILSQAEHGHDSHIVFVSDNEKYIAEVLNDVGVFVQQLPRKSIALTALSHSQAVLVEDLDKALQLVNFYAPEHLILASRDAERLAREVNNAGSVFVGAMSPEAAGDYATGTNHTLPTDGHARAYSGVSLDSFVKKITFQQLSEEGLKNVGPTVAVMAEAEGLEGHKRAVTVRLEAIS